LKEGGGRKKEAGGGGGGGGGGGELGLTDQIQFWERTRGPRQTVHCQKGGNPRHEKVRVGSVTDEEFRKKRGGVEKGYGGPLGLSMAGPGKRVGSEKRKAYQKTKARLPGPGHCELGVQTGGRGGEA